MSFANPVLDILKDAFRPYTGKSYLILSDHHLPVRVAPCPEPAEFNIYTTSSQDCEELGSLQYRYQRPVGFMCHGFTRKPVKEPYVGQNMFFWTVSAYKSVFSGQKVLRIYDQPIMNLLPDPWKHMSDLCDQINLTSREWQTLNITTSTENSYDKFFKEVLLAATNRNVGGGWTLPENISQDLFLAISSYVNDELPIFHSCLISEENRRVVISEALYVLMLNALHNLRPIGTQFDTNGILWAV